jgi:hypothetical protein
MNSSEDNPKVAGVPNRAEYFIRRFFERVGAAIDFALRRGGGGVPRTDIAALAAHLERAVEENLREEADRITAPNRFELRYDYETWTRMGAARREFLQRELSSNIYEYIYNRRYKTLDEVQVRIAYDAFTRGLEVRAEFGQGQSLVMPQNEPALAVAAPARIEAAAPRSGEITLRRASPTKGPSQEWRARLASDAEPAGVGRNIANALVIKDVSVSNFHAAFVLRPDGTLEVADRASANGTYVNGVMLESAGKCIVRDGDRVSFGDFETTISISANS